MFCNQCEQTIKGIACEKVGACGKNAEVSDLQDLLLHAVQGLALFAAEGRRRGLVDRAADLLALEAVFATLTNVDFDPARFRVLINRVVEQRTSLKAQLAAAGGRIDFAEPAATFRPAATIDGLVAQGAALNFIPSLDQDETIRSLKQTLLYGLKGIAAYADHAWILGQKDDAIAGFVYEALIALMAKGLTVADCVAVALKAGEVNLRTMELLDAGNTGTYGHPVPTKVPLGAKQGKCILITGHDLKDLQLLLEQTSGTGVNVYTHGEMLPAHAYPELKKHAHLHGHFGTAWQNQHKEFPEFPGPVLFTTNCIQKPLDSYKDRVFTNGLVGWPGCPHLSGKDYAPVIAKALAMEGFAADTDKGSVMVGFGRNAVLGVADTLIAAVKNKTIRHFFLVGGCDGAKPGRDYYTRFVEQVPADCMVLTLACGKFRFFDKDLGSIGGIPRLLDVGQCNDAYSAIKIAAALADAFGCGINELPLSMILSWYEQKAVAILLTLLHLGVRDIRLGPSLPAFVTPAVLQVLVDSFAIKPVAADPAADLAAILGTVAPETALQDKCPAA